MADMTTGTVRRGAVVLAMVVALAGCGAAKVTPIVIHLTPTPAASEAATPTAESTATSAASEAPSGSASASASVAASQTAAASATAAASGAGTACTGTPAIQTYFADAASQLSFDVYCAALPSTWWLQDTQYTVPNGGQMTIIYKTNGGGLITVGEGNFCSGAPLCWTSTSDLGAASFGPLAGTLKLRAAGQYAVYVNAGTTHGYQIIGQGMSQATFVSYAAAMVKVQKG